MRKSAEQARSRPLTGTRILGALALLVIGAVHYQQYRYGFYSSIPTIGGLFLVNFLSAAALGLLLLAPLRSWLGRAGGVLHEVAALAGIGVAAGGLIALVISEHTPLFGFMEHGYRFVIVLAIASDAAAVAVLTLFLIRGRAGVRRPGVAHAPPGHPPNVETRNQRPVAPAAER
jgi:hypothetical protein